MSIKKGLWSFTILISIMALLIGCNTKPKYALVCNIDTESFGFEITNESGKVTVSSNNEKTSYKYGDSGDVSSISVDVDRNMLFEETQHDYHITGTINVDPTTDEISYDITATSDVFGDIPQTCKQP